MRSRALLLTVALGTIVLLWAAVELYIGEVDNHTSPGDIDEPTASSIITVPIVTVAGSRPVGTYLCSYFPDAVVRADGCVKSCFVNGVNFTCRVFHMATVAQLHAVDIVVNHHGPVPSKVNNRPLLTVFYSGESNASERKKATAQYQRQYDVAVSFHRKRAFYFTWAHRFKEAFEKVRVSPHMVLDTDGWSRRRAAAVVFISRCNKGLRHHLLKELMKYFPVYSFGRCLQTHQVATEHPECEKYKFSRYPHKMCVLRRYQFALALDNTREEDYVTEKVYHALLSGAVPVYYGAPNVGDLVPGGRSTIIDVMDHLSSEMWNASSLAIHLHKISKSSVDGKEMNELFAWRTASQWGASFEDALRHEEPTCRVAFGALLLK